ncbi:hypothetical protein R2601_04873 [Salipiger bermudensis HTCC2601]|uniref:Uncharacterized protein n=1 Tax=Salipiger bermudensis (strain DSM 26914 / JCM 13377 / KCTC 12554 / HTCC2601) TaxID=314265 RepID=Q0FSC9_SALBH|nr:hypothetical protein R2601_04873 [Salipiger bermudensis HTCC2601]
MPDRALSRKPLLDMPDRFAEGFGVLTRTCASLRHHALSLQLGAVSLRRTVVRIAD